MTTIPLDFASASRAVARHARRTPLLPAVELSERVGRTVLLKAESLQHTGSFKVRGAAARLEALGPEERAAGVVACSSGNHGKATAFVAARLGIPASIFVPEWVDPVKLEGIRSAGAETVLAGETFDASEALAIEHARSAGLTYVSAYDDPYVIAGQGTIALEILEELDGESPAAIVAPLSGGGLIGGIAAAFSERIARGTMPTIVAGSAENAAVMRASLEAGRPVELEEHDTLANALSGGIGLDNRWSFDLVRDTVEEHVSVTEDEIAAAMRYAVERLRLVVEGGGAVGLAALLGGYRPGSYGRGSREAGAAGHEATLGGPIVVVLSGGNVASETLVEILGGG